MNSQKNKFISIQNKLYNYLGFTLVELVVLITILVVLASIGFVAVKSHLVGVRDSSRVIELDNMNTSLSSYILSNGFYPKPDGSKDIVYSGAVVWKQGVFGESVAKVVGYSKDNILDPKTGNYYTYSIKNTRKEASIAGVLESEENKLLNAQIINSVSASKIPVAVVVGDYNGAILHTRTGTTDYILAVPSIIASDLSSNDLTDILSNNRLVYNGYANLPASYSGSIYTLNNGVDLSANDLIVFSGSLSDLSSERERLILLNDLKEAYLNTDIENHFLGSIVNFEINTLNPSRYTANLACDLVRIKLNYKIDCEYVNFKAFYVLEDNTVLQNIDYSILSGRKINYIFQDSANKLWFATDYGAYSYDLSNPSTVYFDSNYPGWNKYTTTTTSSMGDGLIKNNIRVVAEDGNGDIWFGTFAGLSRFDGTSFTDEVKNKRYADNSKSKLPHNSTYDMAWDTSNSKLYIATHKGVGIYSTSTSKIDDKVPLSGSTWYRHTNNIFIDKFGIRWYGTNRGLLRDKSGIITRYNGNDGLPFFRNSGGYWRKIKTRVNTIGEDTINNELWIGTEDGIGRLTSVYGDGTIVKYYTGNSALADNRIYSIYQDANTGKMWFGTAQGVSIFDRTTNTFENFYTDKDGQALGPVYFIYSANGLTILGTGDGTTTLE